MKYNVYLVDGNTKKLVNSFFLKQDAIDFVNTSLNDVALRIVYE
jgi:hypothetical protein